MQNERTGQSDKLLEDGTTGERALRNALMGFRN